MNALQKHLKSLDACEGAIEWVGQFKGRNALQKAWDACESGYWMDWYVDEVLGFETEIQTAYLNEQRSAFRKYLTGTNRPSGYWEMWCKEFANIVRKHIPKVPK